MAITKQAIYTIDKYPNYQFTSEQEALEMEALFDIIQTKPYLHAYQHDNGTIYIENEAIGGTFIIIDSTVGPQIEYRYEYDHDPSVSTKDILKLHEDGFYYELSRGVQSARPLERKSLVEDFKKLVDYFK
jgi:hypothetical protein